MKEAIIKILQYILKKLAQLTVWRYEPGVIVITGNVGKTSTKETIAAVLRNGRNIRYSSGNFNNELGVPLTIIGDWDKISGWFFWPRVLIMAVFQLIFKNGNYPELLILEYAAGKPGDIKYLLEIARPQIGVITAIGEIPAHVEFFSGSDAVAREKSRVVEHLPSNGFAVLNFDDEVVMDMKERTRAHVITFGFGEGAEVRITNFEIRSENGRPDGIWFKLVYGGNVVPFNLKGVFGKPQAYATAAAAAVGIVFGANLVKSAEALAGYRPIKGRMSLLPAIKMAYIIDDSYNAAPLSMRSALDTLKALKVSGRKIAVLGDMLEIGRYALEAHEEIGRMAAKTADFLITVGPRAKFIAEHAVRHGLSKRRVMSFDVVEDAIKPAQDMIRKGDVVLVKASRAIQLDKLVKALIV
ncbi:hypothetical protein A3A20_01460 [Candidatus Wolfebacteria bacterium RIFCSPLOWO2_01_FULL_45_19]|uniref:UDP-N-acetylmuramoyl-tripeptide--D-alanyl-D-alanine ligase n=1 Tax=Candidatus Wolfebacteria bacterium RIFCSPLOWO2_01_FULL_45_19 TaxID=1802557 RepID=A0A1F8DSJ4_9BACT|nr:MAG: hypothetical protein A3A20_01460 [Candidatus Wolfebacteria bacterium RIFCSPLOWO2_01_FULL_45_19]